MNGKKGLQTLIVGGLWAVVPATCLYGYLRFPGHLSFSNEAMYALLIFIGVCAIYSAFYNTRAVYRQESTAKIVTNLVFALASMGQAAVVTFLIYFTATWSFDD